MAKHDDSDDEATASTLGAVRPTLSPDGAMVTVLSGGAKGLVARIPGRIGEKLSIGKSSANDLVLPDETVSRRHAELRRTAAGIEVHDVGSTNGIRVGGATLTQAVVVPGTILQVGDVELLVGVEVEDVAIPPSAHQQFGIAFGSSLPMRCIFGVLERIAATQANVLLTGETGTGKDALARSIHARSARAEGPFEVVDCGAVTGTLIESELFGHERGAFTGAVASRAGAFERAAGGTLFLDEIGELAPDLQPKLLRVIESRSFRRVGGTKTLSADVRIVAATTRHLAREVKRGGFRDDLYYRLAVVTLEVPPLRARIEDVPLLAQKLLESLTGADAVSIDDATLAALKSYDWPGNVRELRNVLERAHHMSLAQGSGKLVLADFPPPHDRDGAGDDVMAAFPFDEALSYRELHARFDAMFERQYVQWILARHGGNVAEAARSARMDRNHLADLANRYGVERRRRGRS